MLGSHRDMHTYPDSGSDSHRWMWSGTSSQRLMYKAQLQGRFHLWSQVQSICLHCCHHPWWRTDSDQENMQEIVRFVKLWIKINSYKLIFIIGLRPPMKTMDCSQAVLEQYVCAWCILWWHRSFMIINSCTCKSIHAFMIYIGHVLIFAKKFNILWQHIPPPTQTLHIYVQ